MANPGNHILDRFKRTRLEAGKEVKKQLSNLSKRHPGPELRQWQWGWAGARSESVI